MTERHTFHIVFIISELGWLGDEIFLTKRM